MPPSNAEWPLFPGCLVLWRPLLDAPSLLKYDDNIVEGIVLRYDDNIVEGIVLKYDDNIVEG